MSRALLRLLTAGLLLVAAAQALAADWVVMDARGGSFKPGQPVPAGTAVTLKEGERLSLISPDGKAVNLRGPYSGPATPGATGKAVDPKEALAALLASRDARTRSVGVVRSGTASVATPDSRAIDITRGGPRCLRDGEQPELWRPDSSTMQPFVLVASDRSWRADFVWLAGEDRIRMPDLTRFDGQTTLLVNIEQREFALSFARIPQGIDGIVLAAWMLEKGCLQQAAALLRELAAREGVAPSATGGAQ